MKKGNKEEVEDTLLAKACIEGNDRAQAQLFHTYGAQMMAVCNRYADSYDEAQDLFQEGFIKVFSKLHKYDGKGPLGAWIRRTITNNALDKLRKDARERKNNSLFEVEFKALETPYEDSIFDEEEKISNERLMELVSQMPKGYRTVFNLYVVEEYSHKEIAEQLGITESTSKTQYRKAKAYMRGLVEQEYKKILSE
jgi:RNA polymerase sigma-70 factor (ECF subfamily)